jgi:hypothetical protein
MYQITTAHTKSSQSAVSSLVLTGLLPISQDSALLSNGLQQWGLLRLRCLHQAPVSASWCLGLSASA